MAKIRKDPYSGALIFHHTPRELENIKSRRQFNQDRKEIHGLKIELEKELKELKARKK